MYRFSGCQADLHGAVSERLHLRPWGCLAFEAFSIQEVALLHGIALMSLDAHLYSTRDSYEPTGTDVVLVDYANFVRVSSQWITLR